MTGNRIKKPMLFRIQIYIRVGFRIWI